MLIKILHIDQCNQYLHFYYMMKYSLQKNIHNQFIQDIESSRGDKITQNVFTGLFWTGIEAKRIGLIDDLLSTYDVSEKFFNNNPLIVYNKEKDIVKELLNSTLNTSNTIFGIKY